MNFESAASSPYASRPGSPGRRGSGFGAPGGIHSGRASGVSSPASVTSNIAAPSHGLRHSSSSGSLGGFAGLSMTGINPHHAQSSPRSGGVAIGQHPAASNAGAGQPFPMGFSPMAQYSALGAAIPQQNQFMPQQQHQHVQGMPQPQIPQGSGADSSNPALAYANAQLSYYALAAQRSPSNPALGGFSVAGPGIQGAPPNLNPHALSSALSDYSNSLPGSAASSPGAAPRRLPTSGAATGASTPGGLNAHQGNNSRFAASAVTGKRLNWSEMICQTIAESDQGKLVIQDLFEQMCTKFPEIREWAFGKDWEARVKNRIKSTLSIKGNLFVKVPRPSSAAGKGSWWTLSAEAQEAWKTGRVASVVKGNTGHTRSSSSKSIDGHALAMSSTANSRTASRAPSRGSSRRGSPVSSRGPSSQHAQRESQHVNAASTKLQAMQQLDGTRAPATPSAPQGFGSAHDHAGPQHSVQPSHAQSSSLNPATFAPPGDPHLAALGLGFTGAPGLGLDGFNTNERRMRLMEDSVNNAFSSSADTPASTEALFASLGLPASMQLPLGVPQSAAHLGGSQSMPFPASGLGVLSPTPAGEGLQSTSDNSFDASLMGIYSPNSYTLDSGGSASFDTSFLGGALASAGQSNGSALNNGASHLHGAGSGEGPRGEPGTPSAGFHVSAGTPLESAGILGASPIDSSGSGWFNYGVPTFGDASLASAAGGAVDLSTNAQAHLHDRRASQNVTDLRGLMPKSQPLNPQDPRDGKTPTPANSNRQP